MKNFVIVCIGCDKISGDALGPLVGELLRNKYNLPCPVYGTIEAPVNGVTMNEYREMLESYHNNADIIAIDAAVGSPEEIGKIKIRTGGIKAAGALNDSHKMLGSLGIMGVVAPKNGDVLGALLEAPFALVERLAEKIARSISFIVSLGRSELALNYYK